MAGLFQAFPRASEIDRRATSFTDPIERLRYLRQATGSTAQCPSQRRWIRCGVLVLVALAWKSDALVRRPKETVPHRPSSVTPAPMVANVWPVEQTREFDLYSNGLRIENQLEVSNE